MPQYAIMRFQKHKNGAQGRLESHHERKKEKYASNPDIDTKRSSLNYHFSQPVVAYRQEIDNRITSAGCKTRKDSVLFIDTLITASPVFFKGKKRDEVKAYFERAYEFISRKVGKGNIFTAVVHLDEKTPHMHLCFTPITKDGRLSAKEIIGNKAQLVKWQDDFFKYMVKAYPDLERGEPATETHRKHIPTRVFKQAIRLTVKAKKIQDELSGINPLNIGKKRDAVLALLEKFFPEMEDFETQVKKYKREFERLEKENRTLVKKVNDSKTGLNTRMETAKLQVEVNELRKFYDSVPDEYKRQLQQSKSTQREVKSL